MGCVSWDASRPWSELRSSSNGHLQVPGSMQGVHQEVNLSRRICICTFG